MNQIVKINASEFGLTDETAKNIKAQFQPMLDKMEELETAFNQILDLSLEDPETAAKAKDLRLQYVKVRTGTEKIHKAQKAFYLNGGRFVDGWKNAQIFASQGKEKLLQDIETHLEDQEREKIGKLDAERFELVRPYVGDSCLINFGTMEEDVFLAFLSAKKKDHEDLQRAQREAEEARIQREAEEALQRAETERKDREERERQRLENIRLKEEADALEAVIKLEREKGLDRELEAKIEIFRKSGATILEDSVLIRDLKGIERTHPMKMIRNVFTIASVMELCDYATAWMKSEADRIERENKEAQAQAEADRVEAERRKAEEATKAPVRLQLTLWIDSFEIPAISLESSKKDLITGKFEAFKAWAKKEIETL